MPANAQGIRAGRAYVELGTSDKLSAGLRSASTKMKAFGKGIAAIGSKLAALDVIKIAPLVAASKVFADMGSNLLDMSGRTGLSVEALSELGFAAEQSGASMEDVEIGIKRMQRSINEAATGSKAAQQALGQLGLTVGQLKGLSPEDQFALIAERLGAIEDPSTRAALAMEILGRSGTKLLPMISELEALKQQARDLGIVISTDDAKAADAFGDKLSALWKVLKVGVFTIGKSLAPVIERIAGWLTMAAKAVKDFLDQNQGLITAVVAGAAAFIGLEIALAAVGLVIAGFGSVLGIVATGITLITGLIGFLLSPLGLLVAALAGAWTAFFMFTESGGQALSWLGTQFDALKDTALTAFGGIMDALAAGDFALAAKIAWAGLKTVWLQGVGALEDVWLGFKNFFLNLGQRMVFGFLFFVNDAFASVQVAWVETTAFIGDAWDMLMGALQKGWNKFAGFFQKAWARIKSLFGGEDAETAVARINEETAAENEAIDQQTAKKLDEREKKRLDRRAGIEEQRAAAEQGLQEELDKDMEAREKARADARLKNEEEIAAARAELEEAAADAAAKREAADLERMYAAFGEEGKKPRIPEPEDISKAAAEKIDVQGTFSAASIRGLGAESLNERIAKATEKAADGIEDLNRKEDHEVFA